MNALRWEHWRNVPRLPLWQAAVLSCNVDPRQRGTVMLLSELKKLLRYGESRLFEEFSEHLERAEAHAGPDHSSALGLISYAPPLAACDVRLNAFAIWAKDVVKSTIAAELVEIANRAPTEREQTATRWPWGNHESALLEHLAAAAERFWRHYDPDDLTGYRPSTR